MSAPVSVDNLHKSFVLSHSGAASLKTAMLWWKRRNLERLDVLKGITFDVAAGETVAVVGRNGAGKSTLLSLLARVYKPTSGKIMIEGRLAPLLELGSGFHPDLTGLENVFFNGVILGLTRKEMRDRLDRIVAFSELETHIDAPVRTYSSGMLARLGFAVAVNVDAKVLLVDEALAVGDFSFQEKCFARIQELKSEGAAILFVSHLPADVLRVADRCIWLSQGHIAAEGDPHEVMSQYGQGAAAPPEAL